MHPLYEAWFTYRAPDDERIKAYSELRKAAKELADTIARVVPNGPDQSVAIRKIREAIMTANAGIACEPGDYEYRAKN